MSLSMLADVVESFGAVKSIQVDDENPALLSIAQIIFADGVLTIAADAEDDSLSTSIRTEPDPRFHDVSRTGPWSLLIGGRPLWIWTLTNHAGYVDGIQLQVRTDDRDTSLQLLVLASSLEPSLVEPA